MINALYGHRGTYGEYLELHGDSPLCEIVDGLSEEEEGTISTMTGEDGNPVKYKFWADSKQGE